MNVTTGSTHGHVGPERNWNMSEDNNTNKSPDQTDETPLLINAQYGDGFASKIRAKDYTTEEESDSELSRPQVTQFRDGNKTPGFVYFLTFISAIGGFLFGYDTGVVSGAMLLVDDQFSLSPGWHEVIVSVTIGAAAVFAIVGGFLNDIYGRRPTTLIASFVFTTGAVLLGTAVNKYMLMAGRVIIGIGIGFASTTVPMYIAESAPAHLRGRLVTLNNIFITGGQFIASAVDGAFCYDHSNGWRYMLGLAGVPSFIQFIGFIFMPESPRWLVQKGKEEEARKVLNNIRSSGEVESELDSIKTTCEEDERARQQLGNTPVLIQMLRTPQVRRALLVGCLLQMFQQLSGINTVMYYSASIIKLAGFKDQCTIIWLSAVTAFANFAFTFVGLYLVEKIGRRSLTLGSLGGTVLSLVFLAVGFQLAAMNSPPVTVNETVSMNSSCFKYSDCNSCMMNDNCGFCYTESNSVNANGSCLPALDPSTDKTGMSLYGRCNSSTLAPGMSWAYDFCPTNYSWMAVVGLVLYLAFFAPGMGPMPWTINSEIYPLWARSTGNAVATSVNWIFNLFISITFLTFTQILTRYGAFWLYSGLAAVGWILLYSLLRETKDKTLEQLETLYVRPWC